MTTRLLIAALVILSVGCGKSATPVDTVKRYFRAIAQGDIDTAVACLDGSTAAAWKHDNYRLVKSPGGQDFDRLKIERETIDGDSARVEAYFPGIAEKSILALKKV